MRASSVLAAGHGWCVTKAALLAAACRAAGIPARPGFADVRNHLSTERMRQTMTTDVFAWHGYTDIWLDGAWRKATPAFNVELCERFGLLPLEFDGQADSIYHPFDPRGQPPHGIPAPAWRLAGGAAGRHPGDISPDLPTVAARPADAEPAE
jgi:transglutaminase-like putative cysteine protease